ncbi:Putative NAD(P)-binding domain, NAD(P)-binding domain superfamily [Septoria linicola]|uniref:NAD(P)-binding domain, NAD(P)-binding domain superfamily n=1 Tax=Septoria linicola TaxID=215465 RepID=A0A9Q9EHS9_9PEZI|nr:Putative NAD(P)-binding domain, NAD(P)-binding domain superfamily [Septoria linicola]
MASYAILGCTGNVGNSILPSSLDDESLLADCLSGTRAVFVAIAVTSNQPGVTIAQDTAKQVIAAMDKLRQWRSERLPKLIVLSSASTDHSLMAQVPSFLRSTLYCACSNIYDDLKLAEKFYRAQEDCLSTVHIKPGGLSNDARKGHELSLTVARTPLSFLDLAAGMVEVADDSGERYEGRGVAVNATSKDVAFPWDAPLLLMKGLVIHFLPWTYRFLG